MFEKIDAIKPWIRGIPKNGLAYLISGSVILVFGQLAKNVLVQFLISDAVKSLEKMGQFARLEGLEPKVGMAVI